MHWTTEKDVLMFREVIGEGVFNHKSGSRERGNAWQNVATSLNKLDGFVLTARAVRDRVTTLIKKFSAQNNKEKKLSGEGGEEPSEYDILLQDLLDLSKDSDTKHEEMTEQKKATLDAEKQKALDIRDIAMKNLKDSQQIFKEGPPEKRARRSSSDTFLFLREKLEYDKEFREKELNLKKEERTEFRDAMIQQQRQSNEVLSVFTRQCQAQSEQQTFMQQQMQALMVQQQQQMQIFMGLLNNKK